MRAGMAPGLVVVLRPSSCCGVLALLGQLLCMVTKRPSSHCAAVIHCGKVAVVTCLACAQYVGVRAIRHERNACSDAPRREPVKYGWASQTIQWPGGLFNTAHLCTSLLLLMPLTRCRMWRGITAIMRVTSRHMENQRLPQAAR